MPGLSELYSLRSNGLYSWLKSLDKAFESWDNLTVQQKTKQQYDQIVDSVLNHYYIRGLSETQRITRLHLQSAVPVNPLKRKLDQVEAEEEQVDIAQDRPNHTQRYEDVGLPP